ncbi:hypothetical protein HMPREF9727_00279 [Treponema denticola MYR-T]|jgi:hypothetical protein|uniref:Uncharacterized protein n=3 Tax=Treponema denticola TaxID=158 RepID=M2BTL7_TREDN|nr:hypothetical protein HMPREF9727_00279 [Treponema denticola MYR-T]EMB32615.1 hypothetical protein HMPREF9725_00644 [Treponema denticola H1-T]EMB33214.1 hypothetical protein HMPREF9726_01575 [Treponema denticola H-22]EMB44969.1 hypothetical protein HMPREF9730_01484 [Treponema denticola AL-2]EMB47278.1 hypothetical protein HMPREF9729_01012 [Treponema denticola ASLM]EMD57946.1 hypothetical protein HMPREF9728_00189 [Treponema denticola US-Trep]UTC89171.1 hypothetical protein E4N79_12790 [Trepon
MSTIPLGKEKVITAYMESGNMKYYIRPEKMVLKGEKANSSHVMADFTYQMKQREYVSDAYFNFTLHNKADAFILKAYFILDSKEIVELFDLNTLDRNLSLGYVRVSTIIKEEKVKDVLLGIHKGTAVLKVVLDNNTEMEFIASKDLINRIEEAFHK